MAIDFPATTGQATDGSYTHTASGITWAWDGTTWKAQGVTNSYTLPTASATVLGGVKVGTGLNINAGTGVLTATGGGGGGATALDGLSDVTINTPTTNQVLKYDGSEWTNQADAGGGGGVTVQDEGSALSTTGTTLNFVGSGVVASGTGAEKTITIAGGGSTPSRQTFQQSTSSIASGQTDNIVITAFKTFALLKIQTNDAAWVTLYKDSTSRSADSGRNETTDPLPGSGVLAEVITTGAQTVAITPGVFGWNDDATPAASIYAKVVNKSATTQAIDVTITAVKLEG